jgi:hypothetical protein
MTIILCTECKHSFDVERSGFNTCPTCGWVGSYQVTTISDAIKNANGTRRQRTVGDREAADLQNMLTDFGHDPQIHTIRVYSRQGFVANAYKYRADISVLEARRNKETNQFEFYGFHVDAKRPHGSGSLITINGRAI